MKYNIGDKIEILPGSGVSSSKKYATVISKSEIKTDGKGVPTNIPGAYKAIDWKKEIPIK